MRRPTLNRLLFAFVPLFALLTFSAGAQSSAADIPYIHYYDYLQQGLVIERADGTDSRLIPLQGPEGQRIWSPSGRWFVPETFGSYGVADDSAPQVQVVSTNGERYISVGAPDLLGYRLLWAPHDDVLLIMQRDVLKGIVRFQLFDVEQQRTLADTSLQYFAIDLPHDIQLAWAADGQIAWVSWDRHVVTLHRNGYTAVRIDTVGQRLQISPGFERGRLLYPYRVQSGESVTLRLEDVQTNHYIEIEDQQWGRPPHPYRIRWSPTLEHALIYAYPCAEGACEDWLKLVEWRSGTVQTITPILQMNVRDNMDCYLYYNCSESWSPNGNYAALTDENGQIYVLDANTGVVRQLHSDSLLRHFRWSHQEHLYMIYEGSPYLYRYDPATDQTAQTSIALDASGYGFFISLDDQYIGLSTVPPTIVDQNGEILVQTLAHSFSSQSSQYPINYTWSEASNWVMADYNISFAGGGVGPTASVLFNLEGTVRRELPSLGQAGFVPDNAVQYLTPGQATSVKKEPLYTLQQNGLVTGIGWHPTDPDQLVSYSAEDGLVFWSLAGESPEIVEQISPVPPYPVGFPIGFRLFWLPEQDIVAFENQGIWRLDSEANAAEEAQPVEGVAYPVLETVEDGYVIRHAAGRTIPLDPEAPLGARWVLTSDQEGFIVFSDDYTAPAFYVDATTGGLVQLDITGNLWTADAHREAGIAAFGYIYDCCVRVFDITNGDLVDEFYTTASSLAFSADGRRLATTARGMINIWEMSEYEQQR